MQQTKISVNIEEEMKQSYLDYAMSVIIGRALPDVRDGLKPVHRRILYAMFREGLLSNRRYSKSAGVVGEVLKKYHPHGDAAVYDSIVRLVQEWNMRYPLIDGQGNFGSVDGDPAAAYRYTEVRLRPIAEDMLVDIDKDTVDFVPNFDNSSEEPVVLPTKVPNLLINGSSGIAVGMATNIPPHNLIEVADALTAMIKNPEITIEALLEYIPGPDFPTGAYIHGREGIKAAYETGRGTIQLRARAVVEKTKKGEKESIVITELPYQVNKSRLIEKIAEHIRSKKIEGISNLRDESDREGIRIVIELKKPQIANAVLNQLYKTTPLQTTFGIILLTIDNAQPRVLNLKELLKKFIDYRREVITRRTRFELQKAEQRAHILQGLKIALDHLDEVISIIKASKEPSSAKEALIKRFSFSEQQAQAILEMRLQRLTGMEREKVLQELKETAALIKKFRQILASNRLVNEIIIDELSELKSKYGDERRTKIIDLTTEIDPEDLIIEEDMVVTITNRGYVKRNPISSYRSQRRGGKGRIGMDVRNEDFVEHLFVASTREYILVFTDKGKLYWLKVHEIPQSGMASRGKAIVNLLNISKQESIAAILAVKDFEPGRFVVMATKRGMVKKTALAAFKRPRQDGIIAMNIEEGDGLIAARITDGAHSIFLGTKNGKSICFDEKDVRSMGRGAKGVKGIRLGAGDEVVSMETINNGQTLLTVTEKGYGKRTYTSAYRMQSRGGMGVITIKTTSKNGKVVGIKQVNDEDGLMLITSKGKIIRINARDISIVGRSAQGVKLIEVEAAERVMAVAKVAEKD